MTEAVATPAVRNRKYKRSTIAAYKVTEAGPVLFLDTGKTDINEALKATEAYAIEQKIAGKFTFSCEYQRASDGGAIVMEIAQQTEFKATV